MSWHGGDRVACRSLANPRKNILDQFDLDLGEDYLPSFVQAAAAETRLPHKDLRALRRPILAIFDSYEEAAGNDPVASWLSQQLLVEVVTSLGLAVIVGGQKVPDFANARWRDLTQHIPLEPITELDYWGVRHWTPQRCVTGSTQTFYVSPSRDLRTIPVSTTGHWDSSRSPLESSQGWSRPRQGMQPGHRRRKW